MNTLPGQEQPTVIIPAYNEAPRIGTVLDVLRHVPGLAAIIVVDDGSTDDTAGVVSRRITSDPRLRLIRLYPNQGKGAALIAGAEAAPTDLTVFLDADLIGLTPAHILLLIKPVIIGQCDVSVALFRGGRLFTDLSHILTPSVSGERCLHWSDYRNAPDLREAGYGTEQVLHRHAQRAGLRCQSVIWRGVTHVTKEEKLGLWRGLRARLLADIAIVRYALRARHARSEPAPR